HYQPGNKTARAGRELVSCSVVVECRTATESWKDVWNHQKRWARTIRVSQPIPYFLSKLSNATFWPLLWAACDPSPRSFGFGALCLVVLLFDGFYCDRIFSGSSHLSYFCM